MNIDVGICSISNGICHLFGRSTVPFEQIHLFFCCSVLVSIILCYLPVNYFDLVLICWCWICIQQRCHVARQLSSITIKTTSPNQKKKANCQNPPTLRKKIQGHKRHPNTFLSQHVTVCPQFLLRLFGRAGVRVGLGGSVTKGCRGLQCRGLDPKKGCGWFRLVRRCFDSLEPWVCWEKLSPPKNGMKEMGVCFLNEKL